jgi:hypothetical protein
MATDAPPATGPAGKGKRKLTREQKLMLGTAGGGGALALLVLARRGSKGGAGGGSADGSMATTGQPYVQPAQYSDAGISAYNNLQSEIEQLGGRLDDLGNVGQHTPTPVVPATPAAGHALSGPWRKFIIRKGQTLQDLVNKSHPAWTAAERAEAARQIAIYNKRTGQQYTKFTADATVFLR